MVALSGWMLTTLLVVLIVMGLNLLIGLYKGIATGSLSIAKMPNFLLGILHYVAPLLILAQLTTLDPTGILVMIGYYVGGIAVVLKYLGDIKNKLVK
ncbi:MAG: hypothetical protein JWN30_2112 [Bacilli bacterium]|nr:hypothetical protein [Bacilli bacterium]